MKLSTKQYDVITHIRIYGKYKVSNAKNPTVLKLIELGICDWNSNYDALVLTDKGKKLEL